ncbi:MAG: TonB-dependent receptor [Gammaproteobacteria bacterium]|nr:MAG: TonB-dependent receptor [Gammaproteobacteria bacterium]TLZ03653.1 MAG: TonB-dependent receptor [Gammaproteobacteria bacterium]TLZ52650.1 MAG: TonB-dependent receptor [Gammaproteobacteria bacterium]
MTNPSRNVRNAVRLALAACASSASGPLVYAQAAPAAAPAPVEEVVVTGSRLLQAPNDISISPITTVTAVDIQQTGLVRTEDVLQNLPSISTESPSGNSISTIGINTVSVRDLGSQRTLVLINNRRMNPGGAGGVTGPGGFANSADLNQIPAQLIERVDVLTGGASAVYGADAVAGVVNFVLNTHYEGVKLDTDYSFNNHKNDNAQYLGFLRDSGNPIPPSTVNTGQNRSLSLIMGANFADGRGNGTAYATYLNSSPAVGYQFDHAGCTLNGGSSDVTVPPICGGSSTSGHGRFLLEGLVGTKVTRLLNDAVDPTTGLFRAYKSSLDSYNYGALSYFQRGAERWTAGAFVHYDASEHASVYSETMYARNTSTAQYGPSGAFAFTQFQTACNNPLLTAQQVSLICTPSNLAENQALFGGSGTQFTMLVGRRNVEGGGRQDNYSSNSIRQVLGVKGPINDVWTYDAYAQVGITQFEDQEANFLGTPQIAEALNVVPNPATNGVLGVPAGAPVCAAALSGADPTCVPWNIWQKGGVTQAALNFLSVPASYTAKATEYVADSSVTGDLGKYGAKLPSANSGLNVNVGAEYRQESYVFDPDFIYKNGFQSGGAPSRAVNGAFRVWEGFTEMRLPLLDEKPGAYLLSLNAGYRYSSYTLGFNTNTYKLGLEWAPVQDVRIRGGYNRAVRAPSIGELFQPAAVGSGGTADACWGSTPVYSLAQCERTGVTPAQYGNILANPAAQINTQTAGTSTLVPEVADTYTFGIVFQPQSIPGLVASVDAFNIKIEQGITELPSNTVIADCALTGHFCNEIHRGAIDGSLWFNTNEFINTPQQNIGVILTKGADLTAHYRLNIGGAGRLSFGLTGTYVRNFDVQPVPTLPAYDCSGLWGSTCGAPLPKWRHVLSTTWGTPWAGLDVTLRWRLIGKATVDRSSSDLLLAQAFYPYTAHIPNYNYIDLAAAIPIGRNVDFRLGVNNIADKNPPLILNGTFSDCPNTSCNDNTWVGTYDTLGRYIYAHLSAKF